MMRPIDHFVLFVYGVTLGRESSVSAYHRFLLTNVLMLRALSICFYLRLMGTLVLTTGLILMLIEDGEVWV